MGVELASEEIAPLIGSRVLTGKAELLSGMHAPALRALLEARGVLVFPEIHMDSGELVAFTRTLGEFAPDQGRDEPTAISINPADGHTAQLTRASFFWHFDGFMNPVPILASLLACERPSPQGGDTWFANTYAAYDALPKDRKVQLEGLKAAHAVAHAQRAIEPEPSYARLRELMAIKSNTLPLVWTHRSGRKSLVIGNTAAGVLGMDPVESLELLVWLRDWATQDRFCYGHSWRPGDLVMWDNTGTLHRVTPYDPDCGRTMRRTKLAGEEPFA